MGASIEKGSFDRVPIACSRDSQDPQTSAKEEGRVPEMGTNPLKALRGCRASNRGSNRGSRGSNRGSKGSRKTPEALRGQGPCSGAPSTSINSEA